MAATRRADELAARLERGWEMVDAAERAGDAGEAERLYRHWERLLGAYMAAYDRGRGEGRDERTDEDRGDLPDVRP